MGEPDEGPSGVFRNMSAVGCLGCLGCLAHLLFACGISSPYCLHARPYSTLIRLSWPHLSSWGDRIT